jgi:aryl-alcohol dehydrogenase-like predicted oxidoreductase
MKLESVDFGGLTVSAQGLGCMGMSAVYGPADWDESIATIHRALELGVTLIDTADMYGTGHNEVLVGRAIHGLRDKVVLATKFGVDRSAGNGTVAFRGSAGYVKQACEASLVRLGVEAIDLYYMHRPPQDAEIEETIGAMADLVAAGKVRFLGVSEVDEALLRRAHAVHPIAAVQNEYSLWTREVEELAPTLTELGVGLVAYSPLGRGFLTGTVAQETDDPRDSRARSPRFLGEALRANQSIADTVRSVAARLEVAPAQVALAWVYARADRLGLRAVPIPGTKRRRWLEQNVAALELTLDAAALEELEPLDRQVQGARY